MEAVGVQPNYRTSERHDAFGQPIGERALPCTADTINADPKWMTGVASTQLAGDIEKHGPHFHPEIVQIAPIGLRR
jgi:hypothetical protein